MIGTLLIAPLVLSAVLILARSPLLNRLAILAYAVLHMGLSVALYWRPESFLSYFMTDDLNILFLLILSVLNAGVAVYSLDFLREESISKKWNTYYAVFLLLFVFSLTGAILSAHLGLFWVFMEATTLTSAPLVFFYGQKSSLEATWKYIFICSIGISLAFVGIVLLSMGQTKLTDSLFFADLYRNVDKLAPFWLKISFPFILIGFGTKMGLAPVHAWLPDAHSEAPSPISALLSGTLLNAAFLGILRIYKMIEISRLHSEMATLLLLMGFLSLFVSAIFILKVNNFKRMLAYSSIENMGILLIGIGVGGVGLWAAMLHLLAHSLSKASFFLTSGNILHLYQTKNIDGVKGLLQKDKWSGWLWIGCFLSIVGFPPFPIFLSKFFLLTALLSKGYYFLAAIFVLLLTVILLGMGRSVLSMSCGECNVPTSGYRLSYCALVPQIVFMIILVWIGIAMPDVLNELLRRSVLLL